MASPAATDASFDLIKSPSRDDLLTRTSPFAAHVLEKTLLDVSKVTTMELDGSTELYGLVCAHLTREESTRSFTAEVGKRSRKAKCCSSDDDEEEEMVRATMTDLGLGIFAFEFEGKPLWALHQTLGEVVGTQCGAAVLKNLVLISDESVSVLQRFCDSLIAAADACGSRKFTVYRFHVSHHYWRRCEVVTARPVESVVLPTALKTKILEDMSDFVEPATKRWYLEHGIPYKRSYLLHGSPGAGKTSLIQALAGRFHRNVAYLGCLTHPDMNDDALKEAINRVPQKSIIVLEDADALFSGRVKKSNDKSSLTFSGVLNALDGVGGCSGQIFVLTTNHREHLDPALIRNGRVDCHVEFADAVREQMEGMFGQFYKGATAAQAAAFADALGAVLGEKTVSCAALQHFFILQRKASAEEAIANVHKVVEEAAAHGQSVHAKEEAKEEGAAKEAAKECAETEKKAEQAESKDDAKQVKQPCKATGKGKEVHVHLHID